MFDFNKNIENTKDAKHWQRQYFKIVDEIVEVTGYKKNEIHNLIKREVLKKYFQNNEKVSTKDLKEEYWEQFLDDVKYYFFCELDILV